MASSSTTTTTKKQNKKEEEEEEQYETMFETKHNNNNDDFDDDDDDEEEEEDVDFIPHEDEDDDDDDDSESSSVNEEEEEEEDTKTIVTKAKEKEKKAKKEEQKKETPAAPSSSSSLVPILLENPKCIKFDDNWKRVVKDEKSNTSTIYFLTSGNVYLHPKPFPPQMRTKDKTEEEIEKHKQKQTEWLNLLDPSMIVCLTHIDQSTINDDVPKRDYKFKIYDCKFNEREFKKEWFMHLVDKFPVYFKNAIECNNIQPCITKPLVDMLKNTSKKVDLYRLMMPEKLFDELTKKRDKKTSTKKPSPSSSSSKKNKTPVKKLVQDIDDFTQYRDYFKSQMCFIADKSRLEIKAQRDLSDLHRKIAGCNDFTTTREGLCFLYAYILCNNAAHANQLESANAIRRKTYKLYTHSTKEHKIVAPFIDFTPIKEEEQEEEEEQQATPVKTKKQKVETKKRKREHEKEEEDDVKTKKKKQKKQKPTDKKKKNASGSTSASVPVPTPVVIQISDEDDLDLIH
jgi:hypothetical protein